MNCSECDKCQGYYRTKRRDINALVNYYCEHSTFKDRKFIGISRTGVSGVVKTTPRWCPKKIS